MLDNLEIPQNELPIACNLSASEQVSRGDEIAGIFKEVQQVNELADGYAFRFPGSEIWPARLVQFITGERNCCPFFTFELLFEPNQGPIWLKIRGPQGVKDFIKDMLNEQEAM